MSARDDLFTAVRTGDAASVRRLLGGSPSLASARDATGLSIILCARYQGQTEALDALLGAAPALDVFEAAATGATARVAELLAADRTLTAAWSADGFTALHLAAFFGGEGAARELLHHGADPNAVARNPMRVMPLHSAAAGRHHAICAVLIEHGAEVNARQQGGFTPLHAAAHNGDRGLVDLLLAHGADPRPRTDDGRTPSALAAAAGHTAIAATLA